IFVKSLERLPFVRGHRIMGVHISTIREVSMSFRRSTVFTLALAATIACTPSAFAQTPADYPGVLTTLGRSGDFKDGVLTVNIPRSDLKVVIGQRAAPTPFGFGGWVALTKGTAGVDVMMGDLVL